jgi:hypothetical protein
MTDLEIELAVGSLTGSSNLLKLDETSGVLGTPTTTPTYSS